MRILIGLIALLMLTACTTNEINILAKNKNIKILENRCPEQVSPINITKKGTIEWKLERQTKGYRRISEWAIRFLDNPTDCDDFVKTPKNKSIKCAISDTAIENTAYCYDVITYWGSDPDKSCTLDPTIFVNGAQSMYTLTECVKPEK